MTASLPLPSRDEFLATIARFPENPGVYIMRDTAGDPIYIGKAVNLRSRVRSYFSDTHESRAQIPFMLQALAAIDWIATNTEAEALILESNLIRQHRPRYNIDLRDDKHFPYLKVTVQEPFPRLYVVRKVEKDGARYFGPYTDASAMRKLATFAKTIFQLSDCKLTLPLARKVRPCINYSMKRCSGACAGHITEESYRLRINDLLRFLSGKRNILLADLDARMKSASLELRFEEAAALRDQMKLIRDASRLQQVDLKITDLDCDVFGLSENERATCLAVLHFRDGLLMGTNRFVFKRMLWDLDASNLESVVTQFYLDETREVPAEIILPDEKGFDAATLEQWFIARRTASVNVVVPQKGVKIQLVAMAEKNARLHLIQTAIPAALPDCGDLQTVLQLAKRPRVIEAFDISNLGESFAVAGMVQFKEGIPNKSGYRRYKIKTVTGQNDFAMMMEAVTRRLTRLEQENSSFPDLLLIDGGKGQLHAAMEAIAQFKNPPEIVSLAKKEEILYSPSLAEPVALPPSHPARKLVERIRNEVHRYAITYHKKLRGKQFSRSSMEELPGIGPAVSRLLLKRFGSARRIAQATPEEIANIRGITIEKAIGIKKALEKAAL